MATGEHDRARRLLDTLVEPPGRSATDDELNTAADIVTLAGPGPHLDEAASWLADAVAMDPESTAIATTVAAVQLLRHGADQEVAAQFDRAIAWLEDNGTLPLPLAETHAFAARARLELDDVGAARRHAAAAARGGAVTPVLDDVVDRLGRSEQSAAG